MKDESDFSPKTSYKGMGLKKRKTLSIEFIYGLIYQSLIKLQSINGWESCPGTPHECIYRYTKLGDLFLTLSILRNNIIHN